MNVEILTSLGFGAEVELVKQRKCPLCKKPIDMKDFKDELSITDFTITGVCQACQDILYVEDEC